ncbi:UvrD-helicase domain-containing protein [Bacillus sp. CMF12]|uniref:UvrD-helicase domain-containing protein n=1 Tax=Bacillus sp. CMF12 TaxID=2884834 RepID=UPI00207ACB0A|nr:UvrD-helicase domain-containing protein [Bacillus sp. CMF12]USK48026.1 UvrD-helicase domain-containing protein [Bacillus sp. CMF12]
MTLIQPEFDSKKNKFDYAFSVLSDALSHVPSVEDDISGQTSQFLRNIALSDEQKKVAKMNSTHLLIKGTAGSGKSITLLTRMIQKMSEDFGKRFLFVSFNQELVKDAENRFKQSEYFEQLKKQNHSVHFYTFHELAYNLLKSVGKKVKFFQTSHYNLNRNEDNVKGTMLRLMDFLETEEFKNLPSIHTIKKTKNTSFLFDEFSWMKGNGFITLEDYLNCERVGRGKLPNVSVKQRRTIFRLFEYYQQDQRKDFYNRIDREDYALLVIENLHRLLKKEMYDHIFIDEVQDLQPMQLRVLVNINKGTLTLSGDERQRIYKSSPFSYKALGINVQSGHNVVLKRNWRSTYQIMKLANSLQFSRSQEDSKYDDEKYFPRQGDKPIIQAFPGHQRLLTAIGNKIAELHSENPKATFAIIHRQHDFKKEKEMKNFLGQFFTFDTYIKRTDGIQEDSGKRKPEIYFLEAKTTKGLEFDYVFIIDFSIFYYPHKSEIDSLKKKKTATSKDFDDDKKEIEEKEKRILYVSLTRTKQAVFLYFAASERAEEIISPFVKDFNSRDYEAKGFRKTMI